MLFALELGKTPAHLEEELMSSHQKPKPRHVKIMVKDGREFAVLPNGLKVLVAKRAKQ